MIYAYAATALVSTALAFGAGWKTNQWRHDASQKHSVDAAAASQRELHRLEQARSRAALDAQNMARLREVSLRRDAAASQSSLERLRDTSASALRATSGSLAACTAISATYDELLLDSESRYRALAVKADEHVVDLRVQLDTP